MQPIRASNEKGVRKCCHGLARNDTMLVAPGQVANQRYLVIVALGRARVWAVYPRFAKLGCRWQRGRFCLRTSGLAIQSAIPHFVAVQKTTAAPQEPLAA